MLLLNNVFVTIQLIEEIELDQYSHAAHAHNTKAFTQQMLQNVCVHYQAKFLMREQADAYVLETINSNLKDSIHSHAALAHKIKQLAQVIQPNACAQLVR
jgi:hypothetical protein